MNLDVVGALARTSECETLEFKGTTGMRYEAAKTVSAVHQTNVQSRNPALKLGQEHE